MRILFMGDSVTDMCRQREVPDGIIFGYGHGHPFFVAEKLLKRSPSDFAIVNRGIGGDRTVDLWIRMNRKEIDVKKEMPDVVSLLIGINDIWRKYDDPKYGLNLDEFEKNYRLIIEKIISDAPNAKIILNEPFALCCASTALCGWDNFSKDVVEYSKKVQELAKEYGLYFLPLQQILNDAEKKYGARYVLSDGVHPDVIGASLVAEQWLKLFERDILSGK